MFPVSAFKDGRKFVPVTMFLYQCTSWGCVLLKRNQTRHEISGSVVVPYSFNSSKNIFATLSHFNIGPKVELIMPFNNQRAVLMRDFRQNKR
jgi:hypothetical protein